ncbi:MAG TPA: clostripain-related cysteine peptidase [Armatimonadota bacterium]|jgi:hypothetical protein
MPVKYLAPFIAVMALFVLVVAGCGGGGTTGGGLPQTTGQVDGYIYVSAVQALTARATGGTPAVGAQVHVADQPLSAVTDSSGYFLLTGVATGAHTLVVSLAGYQALQIPVTVVANQTTRISSSGTLTPAARKWTIMVYMNADNNLEQYGIENMNQMESVPDNDQVAVLVQFDRSPAYDTSNGNWVGAKRFLVRHDNDMTTINSTLLDDLGSTDMGVPSTLSDFIAWGEQLYPAEHYMVVLWDHGSGWRASSVVTGFTRGISYDDSSGHYLRTTDLPGGLTASSPIDIVAMDACLMQMMEVDYQIRNQCRYVVASEEDVPGDGYPYQTWLADLAANPSMTPAAFADAIAHDTVNYYASSASYVVHSVVDTGQLEGVASALDQFASAMIAAAGASPAGFATARSTAESYADYDFKDIIDYANKVKANVTDATVRSTANSLISAVQGAVVSNYTSRSNSHGLSIYVPTAASYNQVSATYIPLGFASATHWNEWLAAQRQ